MSKYDHEKLECSDFREQNDAQREPYVPRPKWQLVLAWIAVAVVAFGFLGTIYWMINFRL